MSKKIKPAVLAATVTALLSFVLNTALAEDWTQFRGPGGMSVSKDKVPVKFTDKESVAWKLTCQQKELPVRS